jgi:uncharacterized membrane protein
VTELDMTLEDAAKLIISGGMVGPGSPGAQAKPPARGAEAARPVKTPARA